MKYTKKQLKEEFEKLVKKFGEHYHFPHEYRTNKPLGGKAWIMWFIDQLI